MKYANYDETTRMILGWYDDSINKNIPIPKIKISDEAYQDALDNNHNKVNENGTTEFFDFRTPEQIKQEYNAPILAQISDIEKEQQPRATRESYSADDVIREQAMRYIKKYDDQITELRSQLI